MGPGGGLLTRIQEQPSVGRNTRPTAAAMADRSERHATLPARIRGGRDHHDNYPDEE